MHDVVWRVFVFRIQVTAYEDEVDVEDNRDDEKRLEKCYAN